MLTTIDKGKPYILYFCANLQAFHENALTFTLKYNNTLTRIKKWRQYAVTVICCTLLSSQIIHAENIGDAIQPIYTTDILTCVDGVPIQSYNIGGQTMIALEELENYGCTIAYDNSIRTLFANKTHDIPKDFSPTISRRTVGGIYGYTYETDIRSYVNGGFVSTQNIGGKLCVAVEVLGDRTLYWKYGMYCSAYGMGYSYNDNERILYLTSSPDDEPSYNTKLSALYAYNNGDSQYEITLQEKINDYCEAFIIKQDYYDKRAITHIFCIYNDGHIIDVSSVLDSAYGFGSFPYLTVFNSKISKDKTEFTFCGERYRTTGMRYSELIENGYYSINLNTFLLKRIE